MKLKIGITCYPTVGGSGVIATELGKLLAEKGHEIHFITSEKPFRLNDEQENIYFHQVNVSEYSVFRFAPYDISLASKMAEVIKEHQLDILHVHYAIPHAVCAILAKQMAGTDVKIVTTLHGTDITVLGYDKTLSEAIKFGIEQSNRVTAVSKALVDETMELITPNKEIEVIHNFIDERVYYKHSNQQLKQKFNIQDNEKVMIHVSNFRAVKRVKDIVRAFHKINLQIPAKLLLVGDGPEIEDIKQLIQQLQIENHVLLLGKQQNVEEVYSISDLMFLLSEKESFGLVALEAMACGVPCIGTNVGGIPEVIDDGINGFICELGNIDQIVKKSLELLTDDQMLQTFSDHAMNTPEKKFHSDKIVAQYEQVYFQVKNESVV